MESKKINQLATELTPALSDLTIIGDPTTGISKKITLSQMASLFTGTVEEYANLAAFPLVGTADTIYIALDTNILYRWDTGLTSYVELSPNIVTSLVFNDANGFDGTISLVGSTATLTITTALTQGSVPFIGASGALSQDNANLFFDDTNNRLGINTNAPTTALDVFGSGIIGRLNGTSTNNSFLGFASAGTNQWSIGNVQSDHRFRIYSEANTAELVSVLQTGEVGIGIANPLTKLHIFGGASALIANLDANTSVAKSISFRSGNSSRINLEVSGTESGSNAGADLFIRRYSDAGALIDTPLTITRSTGAITLTGALNGTSATFSGNMAIGGTTITDANMLNVIGNQSTVNIGVVLNNTNSTHARIYALQNVNGNFNIRDYTASSDRLSISSTGAATFSSSIAAASATFNTSIIIGNVSSLTGAWGNLTSVLQLGNSTTDKGYISVNEISGDDDINIVRYAYFDNTNWKRIGGGNPSRYSQRNAEHIFQYASSGADNSTITWNTALTLTNGGNVGIGTSNVAGISTNYGTLNINGTNGGGIICKVNDTSRGYFYSASEGTYIIEGASAPIFMYTGGSERMRITGGGQVNINSTQTTYPFYVQAAINTWTAVMENTTSGSNGLLIRQTGGSAGIYFGAYDGGAYKFFVNGSGVVNSTSTSITIISSDQKLKTDIRDYDKGLAEVLAMKPRIYKRKDNLEIDEVGFIAQEMDIALAGSMIESYKDEEGEPIHTYQLEWYPLLVKAIQEQNEIIIKQGQAIEELKALINK